MSAMAPAEGDPMDPLADVPAAAEVLGLAARALPPADLRAQVLAAARSTRPPGRPAVPVEVITAPESFRRMLHDISDLVASLTDEDATRLTVEGWTVTGLLGHLSAIEAHFGAVLGWWPEQGPIDEEHDHLGMTRSAVAAAQASTLAEVRAAWAAIVERVAERLASLEGRLGERVRFHGFAFSIRSLLIARAFEVWTHTEDIAKAIGRPLVALDTARLRLMTAAAVAALPIGMLLTDREPRGRSVRIVLEGDGGGSWVQSLDLGGVPSAPELTLVADAVEFCRVAAKRTSPNDLRCTVIGDADLAADVLASVAVFAA